MNTKTKTTRFLPGFQVYNDPVIEGLVYMQEYYIYSSASFYCGKDCLLEIDRIERIRHVRMFGKARKGVGL